MGNQGRNRQLITRATGSDVHEANDYINMREPDGLHQHASSDPDHL